MEDWAMEAGLALVDYGMDHQQMSLRLDHLQKRSKSGLVLLSHALYWSLVILSVGDWGRVVSSGMGQSFRVYRFLLR
jgi:hypothetical protein